MLDLSVYGSPMGQSFGVMRGVSDLGVEDLAIARDKVLDAAEEQYGITTEDVASALGAGTAGAAAPIIDAHAESVSESMWQKAKTPVYIGLGIFGVLAAAHLMKSRKKRRRRR